MKSPASQTGGSPPVSRIRTASQHGNRGGTRVASTKSWWRYGDNATPRGSNWGHWRNADFDALLLKMENAGSQDEFRKTLTTMHEMLVDEAPWVWIVHDKNPRAMTKQVQGFVSAQSWFQDLTRVSMK